MELKTDRLEESLSWWSKLLLNLCLQDERMIARAVKKQTVKRFQEPSTSLQLSTGQEEERKVLRVLPSSPWVPRNQGWLNFWETKIMTERVWGCGHRKEAFCRRISSINHVTPSRRMREGRRRLDTTSCSFLFFSPDSTAGLPFDFYLPPSGLQTIVDCMSASSLQPCIVSLPSSGSYRNHVPYLEKRESTWMTVDRMPGACFLFLSGYSSWKDSPHVVDGVRKEMERLTAAVLNRLSAAAVSSRPYVPPLIRM